MWRSRPIGGRIFVAMPSLRSSSRLLWWVLPADPMQPGPITEIEAEAVPAPVRRRAYRQMWNDRQERLR